MGSLFLLLILTELGGFSRLLSLCNTKNTLMGVFRIAGTDSVLLKLSEYYSAVYETRDAIRFDII